MEIEDYLTDELKRLNRMNDLLEKRINTQTNLCVTERELIIKNASTMCEIVRSISRY